MRKYMIERTDGETDHIEADGYVIDGRVAYFVTNEDKNSTYTYILSNVVRIINLGEMKEEQQAEAPGRRKNDNEDLISRSGILNFIRTHYYSDVIDVIQTFEKAEYLD